MIVKIMLQHNVVLKKEQIKSFLADITKSKKDNKFYYLMPLRVCVSNCLELMGQTLLGFNIRYANSSHRFYSLQHRLKSFMKLTYSKPQIRKKGILLTTVERHEPSHLTKWRLLNVSNCRRA